MKARHTVLGAIVGAVGFTSVAAGPGVPWHLFVATYANPGGVSGRNRGLGAST
jgi:hypothetical protein